MKFGNKYIDNSILNEKKLRKPLVHLEFIRTSLLLIKITIKYEAGSFVAIILVCKHAKHAAES